MESRLKYTIFRCSLALSLSLSLSLSLYLLIGSSLRALKVYSKSPIPYLNFRIATGRSTPVDHGRFVISVRGGRQGRGPDRHHHDDGGDDGHGHEDGCRAAALGGDGDDRGAVEIER